MSPSDIDMKMRILLAAKKLFALQGFDGTSVRQICEEAGANVALVSYHFGGKEGVFQALFHKFFPSTSVLNDLDRLEEPLVKLEYIFREVIRLRMSDPALMSLVHQEIVLNSPRVDIIREHIFPVWLKVRDLLELGREQGLFRFRSIDNTLMFVLGTVLFPKKNEFFEPLLLEGPKSFEEVSRDHWEFVLNGLGAGAIHLNSPNQGIDR